jgi:hypothetical protein
MRGFVYAIRSNLTTNIYIGSTCSPLSVRMAGHRRDFKCFKAGKFGKVTSFEIIEFGDAYIECIEVVEFTEKVELTAREGHFQRNMVCVNRKIEGRTAAQWYVDNVEKYAEKNKKYYAEHVEKSLAYQKQYSADNADAIKARQSEKITCECGANCSRRNIAPHRRTAKHIKALAALTPLTV